MSKRGLVLAVGLCLLLVGPAEADVFNMANGLTSLEFVTVGNPGNAADMRYNLDQQPEGSGAVDYAYNIGKFEVTSGLYTEFLNAVAATDTYGLYNANMWSSLSLGCKIQRNGIAGGYSYSVAADLANRPVNLVSWADAARFTNWLTNGQPTGLQDLTTTEDGSYFLNGAMTTAELMTVTRRTGAHYVIPSEDEWYKAAYHKNDGVTGNYFDYPTSSDAVPSNDLIDPDPGNNANFYDDGPTIDRPYGTTDVGEFENSASPYGTFDQGGNINEWNETVMGMSSRGIHGGAFFGANYPEALHAAERGNVDPATDYHSVGFRIAEVPEPATMGLLALGGLALLRRNRLRR